MSLQSHAADHCPICGKFWRYGGSQPAGHHCSKRTFAGIDAAETRSDEPAVFADPTNRARRERLKDGLRLIYGDDPPDNR